MAVSAEVILLHIFSGCPVFMPHNRSGRVDSLQSLELDSEKKVNIVQGIKKIWIDKANFIKNAIS